MDKQPRHVEIPFWMKQTFSLLMLVLTACIESAPTAEADILYTVKASRVTPNTCEMTVSGGESGSPVKLLYPIEQVKNDPGTEESVYVGVFDKPITTGERTSSEYNNGYLHTGGSIWCPPPIAIELFDGTVVYCNSGESSISESTTCQ